MEIVPTSDGDEDDGVIWSRCPQCHGFLPRVSGADEDEPETAGDGAAEPADTVGSDAPMQWDSPADMMAAQEAGTTDETSVSPFLPEDAETTATGDPVAESEKKSEPAEPTEPIHEYAAMLAESDTAAATPYRPWDTYEVGQCVHHLAWEDCGVVVAKEDLPGGRKIIKCYFGEAGVVRLIEQAPQ
jgi:hypothetical protein